VQGLGRHARGDNEVKGKRSTAQVQMSPWDLELRSMVRANLYNTKPILS
jgi:hypothetical protein